MAHSKIRIGLIGHGNWGKRIYETLCTFPNVDVSIIEKNAFATHCDAVIIATPSSTHAELTFQYLEKDIPLFVEKPLATSVEDVKRILEYTRLKNSIVFVGYIYLYNNFIDIIKSHLHLIGPLKSIKFVGFNNRPRADSSLLWDWLPHDLIICQKIMNALPILDTVKTNAKNGQSREADIIFHLNETEIISKISSQREAERTIHINGINGHLEFDDRQRSLIVQYDGGHIQFDSSSYIPPLGIELAEFIQIIQSRNEDNDLKILNSLQLTLEITNMIERAEALAGSK